jgi:hypothetical protein
MGPGSIRLAPAIIEEDGLNEFLNKNRTLKAAMSPRTHSLSIFQSANTVRDLETFRRVFARLNVLYNSYLNLRTFGQVGT